MKLQVILLLGLAVGITSACQKETDYLLEEDALILDEESALKSAHSKNAGFVHGLKIDIDGDGVMYYLKGPEDEGVGGPRDVPGHYWVQAGKNRIVGKHYNTGPYGMPQWWSSDAEDGAYLYMVNGIIDTWSEKKAEAYYLRGYVHYHEFVKVVGGAEHPEKVIWLKHTAVTSFTLDGGPGAPDPPYKHAVTPGVDFEFPNNSFMPYNP